MNDIMSAGTGAAVKPIRPAATMLIVRSADSGVEVFTLKRSTNMRFLPSYLAFPGGSVSNEDRGIAQTLSLQTVVENESDDDWVYAVAAIRETTEEIGWLAAIESIEGPRDHAVSEEVQRTLLGEVPHSFANYMEQRGLKINLSRLKFVGRWVTPEYMPARFDTRFFLYVADGVDFCAPLIHAGENEWGRWEVPQELLRRIRENEEQAVPPTLAMLKALAQCSGAAEAWEKLKVPGPKPEDL